MESDFKKRVFDKIFFSFPLCLLAISENKKEVLQAILLFCLEEYKIKNEHLNFLPNYFKTEPTQRQLKNIRDEFIFQANAVSLRYDFTFDIIKTLKDTKELISDVEIKHGKYPFCRIGKDLFQDVLNGNLDFFSFSIYSAITSILGTKKTAVRITKKRIKIRMNGFKDEKSFIESGRNVNFISDKQFDKLTDLLLFKNLISKFTYQRRLTYYSIRVKSKRALAKWIERQRLHHLNNKSGLIDQKLSAGIKNKEQNRKQSISEMQEVIQFENTRDILSLVTAKKRLTL